MEKYKVLEELGNGTCGSVYKAVNMETSEIVAVKKMKRKFYNWEECINLREVKSLRKLNHPNIIKLKEIVRENNELFFIFDYMEYNLYQVMRDRGKPFSEEEIRTYMSQVLQGLAHMHSNGYFHRDLKPENLLVTNNVIKVADFGLARELSSLPPFTEYVSTRWYRAPEVLLRSSVYTPAIDMWAVGAIIAELFTCCPIFPGESEMDQLYKICCVLGMPNWNMFPEARNISLIVNISYTQVMPTKLTDIMPNASLEAIDLIKLLCSWDSLRRPTAEQTLSHPFFHVRTRIPRPMCDPLQLKLDSLVPGPDLELKLWDFDNQPDDFLGLTLALKPSLPNLDISQKVSRSTTEEDMLCSRFPEPPQHSVFLSLVSPDNNGALSSVESSLSLFNPIYHSSIGASQSGGFTFSPLQPNPFFATSSPFQQVHFL